MVIFFLYAFPAGCLHRAPEKRGGQTAEGRIKVQANDGSAQREASAPNGFRDSLIQLAHCCKFTHFFRPGQPAGHDFFLRKNGFGSSAPVPSFRSAPRLDGMRVRARKKGGSQKKISGTCFEKGAGLFCRRATRKQKKVSVPAVRADTQGPNGRMSVRIYLR